MEMESTALRRLLRTQLTAVNQQFVHILALRSWGENALADRIDEVDRADFPVCMKIMDFFVTEGEPMALQFCAFAPGATVEEIVAAELRIEREMEECLSLELDGRHPALPWLSDARRPRTAYVDWLDSQDVRPQDNPVVAGAEHAPINAMFAQLIALVEQAMAHAFVHWHRGEPGNADIAWATSGIAMMKSGVLTRALSEVGETPKAPPAAHLSISEEPETAIELDRQLAETCAQKAAAAAAAATGKIARLCRQIEAYARQVSEHRHGDHPSIRAVSPAFGSFEKTLEKYVQ